MLIELVADFEVVRRIIELTERRCSSVADRQTVTMSSYRYEGKLNHDASSDLSTLDQKTQKVVDRLALMQAYEATLRNHGGFSSFFNLFKDCFRSRIRAFIHF